FKIINSEIRHCQGGIFADNASVTIRNSNLTWINEFSMMAVNGTVLNATFLRISHSPRVGIISENSKVNLDRAVFSEVEMSLDLGNSSIDVSNTTLTGLGSICSRFNSTTGTIRDSNYSSMGGGDLLFSRPAGFSSNILILNSSFDNIINEDPGAYIREGYRFDVQVITNGPSPAGYSEVEIRDRTSATVFHGITGANGCINDIPVATAVHNVTGGFELSPHNITVVYQGATRYATVDAALFHFIQIEVIRSEPEVIIEHPLDSEWIDSRTFLLTGRATDLRPITDIWMSVDGSPMMEVPQPSPFSIPIELFEGPHTIRISAMNDDGIYGNGSVSFGIDTIAPEIVVDSPVSPFFTNRSNVWIQGSCSMDSSLFINDEKIPLQMGAFKTMVLLSEGENIVFLRAVDRAGNSDSAQLVVNFYPQPPSIAVFTPINGTRTKEREIMVKGATDLDTVHLWINGIEADLDRGEFEVIVACPEEGINHIRIIAQDPTGSITTRDIIVIVDTTPPALTITDAPPLTNKSSVVIRGITDKGAVVNVNNRPVDVENGIFSSMIELLEGINNISITASDDLGNIRWVHRIIDLDMIAPLFGSINPASGSELTNPILQISGTVYDENGIRSVRIRTGDASFEEISTEEEFSCIVLLKAGQNIIDLEAEDRAGNTVLEKLSYSYTPKESRDDLEAPTIVITVPQANTTLFTGKHMIEGWAMDNREVALVSVRVDGGGWMTVNGSNSWNIEVEFRTGKIYLIEAKASDPSGNEETARVWVVVVDRSNGDHGGSNISSLSVIIIVVFVLLLLIALVLFYISFTGKREKREEYTPSREKIPGEGKGAMNTSGKGPIPRRLSGPGKERNGGDHSRERMKDAGEERAGDLMDIEDI
ncbi:MAG: hypothetical protein JW939_01650, partial [Candidatus Thermoplasmatota archaeon]|nr:hypothetical protein [Candidatus Thermoplasmatota archaeon]